ncbi:monofunctional biosynthetic peptidoglycan transglycosylase [Mariniflexile sp.]|uniref:monofunctional biosynthetic peptidoglycan transglycosylase n=1 Tax=Mariniflexile sp. TaxID=1979402 RepID=UPI0040478347
MIKKIFRFLFKMLLWFFAISIGLVIVFKWVPVPITPLMVIRTVQQKINGEDIVWKHDWESIDNISKNLQLAVISSEDQDFLNHHGFDMEAIEKALEYNKKGRRTRGASTISQQTAKNVFLWPQRSWLRKGLEAYFTFLIELIWSKERIMEVYLNSIEMGKGIYGAEAAAQYWFKRPAANLRQEEAAAIAAILPNPLRYRANPATNYIQKRKNWIVRQMGYFGPLIYKKETIKDDKKNRKKSTN